MRRMPGREPLAGVEHRGDRERRTAAASPAARRIRVSSSTARSPFFARANGAARRSSRREPPLRPGRRSAPPSSTLTVTVNRAGAPPSAERDRPDEAQGLDEDLDPGDGPYRVPDLAELLVAVAERRLAGKSHARPADARHDHRRERRRRERLAEVDAAPRPSSRTWRPSGAAAGSTERWGAPAGTVAESFHSSRAPAATAWPAAGGGNRPAVGAREGDALDFDRVPAACRELHRDRIGSPGVTTSRPERAHRSRRPEAIASADSADRDLLVERRRGVRPSGVSVLDGAAAERSVSEDGRDGRRRTTERSAAEIRGAGLPRERGGARAAAPRSPGETPPGPAAASEASSEAVPAKSSVRVRFRRRRASRRRASLGPIGWSAPVPWEWWRLRLATAICWKVLPVSGSRPPVGRTIVVFSRSRKRVV